MREVVRRGRRVVAGLVVGALIATIPAGAQAAQDALDAGVPSVAQQEALRALPGISVTWDPDLGVPSSLIRHGGYLTGPSSQSPEAIATDFLRDHAALFRMSPRLDDLYVSYSYPTRHNGVNHVILHERVSGLEVYGSSLKFTIDASGRIAKFGGRYVPGLQVSAVPTLTARQAVRHAISAAGVRPPADLPVISVEDGRSLRTTFENTAAKGLGDPQDITAELVVFPVLSKGIGRLGWKTVTELDADGWYESVVDAHTGALLFQENYYKDAGAEGTVFTNQTPTGATRQVVSFNGWVTDRTTSGNNTNTYQDLGNDNVVGYQPTTPASGDPAYQHFNYPFADAYRTSSGTDVTTDRDAIVTQLFYWTNFTHDYLYGLGFDEAARNFQVDNFGRGGAGGDPVLAEANDGYSDGTRNNANFGTPPDGNSPRMQMYTWDPASFLGNTAFADGSLDADLVIHEYGHGLSERLIDNGTNLGGVQTGAMGEAWGDFYAISIFNDPLWVEYSTGIAATGLRSVRYDASPHTYGDLCNIGFLVSGCEVHNDGEIWASALWDLRTRLITRHGFGTGKNQAEQLVMDGIKGTAVDGSFLDGRDAILTADMTNNAGANQCLIWAAFAGRGMGASASSVGNGSSVTEAFDGPSSCVPTVNAGGPYTTNEGSQINLTATGSDPNGDALTYAWDLNDDGTFETSGATVPFKRIQDGAYPVAVRVTDIDGFTATAAVVVTVQNVAPAVSVGSDGPVDEGSLLTLTGVITDPGTADPLLASVNWGDGSPVEPIVGTYENFEPDATLTFSAAHTYGDNGTYPVSVCASDDDTTTCTALSVDVSNVAPAVTLDAAQVAAIQEGDVLGALATFTDQGWLDTYTYSVTWGEGTSESGNAVVDVEGPPQDVGHVGASKQYGDNGTFPVKITVNDDDGGSSSVSFDVAVANVDPTAVIDESSATIVNGTPTFVVSAGETLPVSARSTDPGSDDLTLTWTWDDGSPDDVTTSLVNPPGTDPFPSPTVQPRDVVDPRAHQFGQACLYQIGFGSVDDDAGTGADSAAVIVQGNGAVARGAGYWKHQYSGNGNVDFDATTLDCYLAIAGFASTVFDEVRDASTAEAAHTVLFSKPGDSPTNKLDREILSAWLNFAHGVFDYGQLIDTNGDLLPDTAFGDVLATAEAVRLDAGATAKQLDEQRKILQAVNRF